MQSVEEGARKMEPFAVGAGCFLLTHRQAEVSPRRGVFAAKLVASRPSTMIDLEQFLDHAAVLNRGLHIAVDVRAKS